MTNLLTPWCRVLLEKLTGLQLVKKFPAFHVTRRFITALTSARQLSLSWASPIQSIYPQSTSWWSILILSTHLRLGFPSGLLPSGFPTKTLYNSLSSPILLTNFFNSNKKSLETEYPKTYILCYYTIYFYQIPLNFDILWSGRKYIHESKSYRKQNCSFRSVSFSYGLHSACIILVYNMKNYFHSELRLHEGLIYFVKFLPDIQ